MNPKKKATADAPPPAPRTERWKIARLKPNPLQRQFFRDLSAADLTALAENIRLRGQKQAVEALPDGTILDGHQRVEALRRNGTTHADVLVRYDLAKASEVEKERAFIETNVLRRQLGPLGKARAVLGLLKAELGKRQDSDLRGWDTAKARERIEQAVGMGERNLNRYLSVLRSAPEVQAAFEDGHLSLVQAARVGALLAGEVRRHKEFAARLRAGEDAKALFAEFFGKGDGRHVRVGDAVAAFARSLETSCADLEGRADPLTARTVRKYEAAFRKGQNLLNALLDKLTADE
jgi:hypothetical protein